MTGAAPPDPEATKGTHDHPCHHHSKTMMKMDDHTGGDPGEAIVEI
jgi:hypothetical protein